MKTEFVNAQQMHKENPKTFKAPTKNELENIKNGDIVKVCCGDERFWVIVTEVNSNTIIGDVDNDLVHTHVHGLSYGDSITFNKDNIYSIYE